MGMAWAGKATAHTWVILHRQTQKGNDRVCLGIKHAGRGRCGTKRPLEEKVQNIFLNTYLPFIKGEMQRQTVQDSSGTREASCISISAGAVPSLDPQMVASLQRKASAWPSWQTDTDVERQNAGHSRGLPSREWSPELVRKEVVATAHHVGGIL